MSDFVTYCAVNGLCYNLVSQFFMKVPWNVVLKEIVVNTGKKVWSNRNSFKLVLKEAQMAQQVFEHFKNTIHRLEQYQKEVDIPICSLDTAKQFLVDFSKVLEIYDPRKIGDWEANSSGDALRQTLQYYITYMHSIMGNIHLEISYMMMQLQTIQIEKDPSRRSRLIQNLKRSCAQRYSSHQGNKGTDGRETKPVPDNDDENDLYSDAEENL